MSSGTSEDVEFEFVDVPPQVLDEAASIEVAALDTERPVVKVGNFVFVGRYATAPGTTICVGVNGDEPAVLGQTRRLLRLYLANATPALAPAAPGAASSAATGAAASGAGERAAQ